MFQDYKVRSNRQLNLWRRQLGQISERSYLVSSPSRRVYRYARRPQSYKYMHAQYIDYMYPYGSANLGLVVVCACAEDKHALINYYCSPTN